MSILKALFFDIGGYDSIMSTGSRASVLVYQYCSHSVRAIGYSDQY
jgi:hypothetical protein